MSMVSKYAAKVSAVLFVGIVASLPWARVAAQDTYLDHLQPIVHFHFNDDAAKTDGTIKSVDGSQKLYKAGEFPNDFPPLEQRSCGF